MIKLLVLTTLGFLPRQSHEELMYKASVACSNTKLHFNEQLCRELYTCIVNRQLDCERIAREIVYNYEKEI